MGLGPHVLEAGPEPLGDRAVDSDREETQPGLEGGTGRARPADETMEVEEHEATVRLEVTGETRRLPGRLNHFPHQDLAHHVTTINRYTHILAGHWPPLSGLRTWSGMVLEPPLVFLHKYFLQRGFLDGRRGLIVSAMTAFYFFLRYAKMWEREHGQGEPK